MLSLCSCSFFYKGTKNYEISERLKNEIQTTKKKDYQDHLRVIGEHYLGDSEIKTVGISSRSKKYIDSLIKKIVSSNELLLRSGLNYKLNIINSKTPFHFSLPGGAIFLSLGLLKKYIKLEGVLASILTYETIKTTKNIYEKNLTFPSGFVSTRRLISLTRVSFKNRMEINKWVFYCLKRAGFDPYSYLTWIQLQNRNTLDFVQHLGDIKSISREETQFKAFLISKRLDKSDVKHEQNSSKRFYRFIREVNRKRYETRTI